MTRLFSYLKRRIVLDTSIYMAGNVLSQGIGFFVLPIFTHYLSPEDYGVFNYTNSIKGVLTALSALSLNSFVLKYYFDLKSEEEKKSLFGTAYLFLLIVNLIILGAEYLILPVIIHTIDLQIPFHPYFEIMIVTAFLETMVVIPLAYFRIKRQVGRFFLMTSVNAILTIVIGLILIIGWKMGLLGRLYGILAASAVFAIIGLGVMIQGARFSIDWSLLKKGLAFSLPILPGAIASMGMSSTDRIVMERFLPMSDIGIYSVGLTLGTLILIIIRSFYRAIEPEIYESFTRPDFNSKIVRMKDNFLLFIIVLGSLMIIFSKETTRLMLAPQFYAAWTVIPFFVVASLFRGAKILSDTTLYALGKTAYEPLMIVLGLILNFVLNLILIPKLGILGGAVASVLTFWTQLAMSMGLTAWFGGIRWGFAKDSVLIVSASLLSAILMSFEFRNLAWSLAFKIGATFSVLVLIIRYKPQWLTLKLST